MPIKGRYRTSCECLCDCGNIVIRKIDGLSKDKYCSCGCGRKETVAKFSKDVIGQKFGRLTVIRELSECTPRKLICGCDCGNEVTISKRDVINGHTLKIGLDMCPITELRRLNKQQKIIKDNGYGSMNVLYVVNIL